MILDKYKRLVDSSNTLVPELVAVTSLAQVWNEEAGDMFWETVPYATLGHTGVGGFSFVKENTEAEGGDPNIYFYPSDTPKVPEIVEEFGDYNSMYFMPTAGLNIIEKKDYDELLQKIFETKNSTLIQAYLKEYLFIRGYIESTFQFRITELLFTGTIEIRYTKDNESTKQTLTYEVVEATTGQITYALISQLGTVFRDIYQNHGDIVGFGSELIETIPPPEVPETIDNPEYDPVQALDPTYNVPPTIPNPEYDPDAEPTPIFTSLNEIEFIITPNDTITIDTFIKNFTGTTSNNPDIPSLPAKDVLYFSVNFKKPLFTGNTELTIGSVKINSSFTKATLFQLMSEMFTQIKNTNEDYKCSSLSTYHTINLRIALISDDVNNLQDGANLKVEFKVEPVKDADGRDKKGISISIVSKVYEPDSATIPNPNYDLEESPSSVQATIDNPYRNNLLRLQLRVYTGLESEKNYQTTKLNSTVKITIDAFGDFDAIDITLAITDLNVHDALELLIKTLNDLGDHYSAQYDWQPLSFKADYGWQEDGTEVTFKSKFERVESPQAITNPAKLTINHNSYKGIRADYPLLKGVDCSKIAEWDQGPATRDVGFVSGINIYPMPNPDYSEEDKLAAEEEYKEAVPEEIENPDWGSTETTITNPYYDPDVTATIDNPNWDITETIDNPDYDPTASDTIPNPEYDAEEAATNPDYNIPERIHNPAIDVQAVISNPNYDSAPTIINPDYDPTIPETIPNPSFTIPAVLLNPDYHPQFIINPDFDSAETILNPEFDSFAPKTIPNPEYDPTIPETIPNPEYDAETNPNVPEEIANPDYDPTIPERIDNPALDVPRIIVNPNYNVFTVIPNPDYNPLASRYVPNPDFKAMIPNPDYDLSDAYQVPKTLSVITKPLVDRGVMIHQSGGELYVSSIYTYYYTGPYRPDLPKMVPNPNYGVEGDPTADIEEIPNPELSPLKYSTGQPVDEYYRPLTYIFSIKVADLFKKEVPYTTQVYDDKFIFDYDTLAGFWGIDGTVLSNHDVGKPYTAEEIKDFNETLSQDWWLYYYYGANTNHITKPDCNFFIFSPKLSREDLHLPYYFSIEKEYDWMEGDDNWLEEIPRVFIKVNEGQFINQYDTYKGEIKTTKVGVYEPNSDLTKLKLKIDYPNYFRESGDIKYGKPVPLKATYLIRQDNELKTFTVTSDFEDDLESGKYFTGFEGKYPVFYQGSKVFEFVGSWERHFPNAPYIFYGSDYVPDGYTYYSQVGHQPDGRRYTDMIEENYVTTSDISYRIPTPQIIQTIPNQNKSFSYYDGYNFATVAIDQIYSEVPYCFDSALFSMCVIQCLKYPTAICFFIEKMQAYGVKLFYNQMIPDPFNQSIVDNHVQAVTTSYNQATSSLEDGDPYGDERRTEWQKYYDDTITMQSDYIAKKEEEELLEEESKAAHEADPNVHLYTKNGFNLLKVIRDYKHKRYQIIANNFASWDLIEAVQAGSPYYYISF